MTTVALTGASGFVGRHVLARLLESGFQVRALVRNLKQISPASGLTPIVGRLDDDQALTDLVRGSDLIVHLAGATGGFDYADFARVNVVGTRRLVHAWQHESPQARFIHLSSLAARHPELSDYAASKRAGEDCVNHSSGQWTIIRPPAVYGPDDPALAPLWRALSRGWLIQTGPAESRFSLVHVDDLADAIVTLVSGSDVGAGETIDLHDGTDSGYGWDDLKALAEEARQKPVKTLAVPRLMLMLLGWINVLLARLLRRRPPPLVPGKVRELVHHNWVCDNSALPGCPEWAPRLTLKTALPQLPGWRRIG
ncbi:MAG: NAD-dependent epimerase/dehydratase family protein [Pseudomonadota bacterium]